MSGPRIITRSARKKSGLAVDQAADERAAQSHRELGEHYSKLAAGCEAAPGKDFPDEGGLLPGT